MKMRLYFLNMRRLKMYMSTTRPRQIFGVLCIITALYLFSWTYPNSAYFTIQGKTINHINYSYLINPRHLCSEHNPSLVVLVLSTIENFKGRQAIRDTWGSIAWNATWPSDHISTSVTFVFFFGVSVEQSKNNQLREEANKFGDILQIDIAEAYGVNVTKKILTGLKWASEHCLTSSHVMKVDDDVFVDMPAVMRRLENTACGSTLCGHKVYVSLTLRSGKYALSFYDYPYVFIPPYLFGYFYVMPIRVAGQLVTAARYVPFIRMEDVYITAILSRVVKVPVTAYRAFISDRNYHIDVCDFVTGRRDVSVDVSTEQMYSIWETYKNGTKC